jgi:rRNA maturation protein Rpf1
MQTVVATVQKKILVTNRRRASGRTSHLIRSLAGSHAAMSFVVMNNSQQIGAYDSA